jgi:hypothetical protein
VKKFKLIDLFDNKIIGIKFINLNC